jgi:hypothetical protein
MIPFWCIVVHSIWPIHSVFIPCILVVTLCIHLFVVMTVHGIHLLMWLWKYSAILFWYDVFVVLTYIVHYWWWYSFDIRYIDYSVFVMVLMTWLFWHWYSIYWWWYCLAGVIDIILIHCVIQWLCWYVPKFVLWPVDDIVVYSSVMMCNLMRCYYYSTCVILMIQWFIFGIDDDDDGIMTLTDDSIQYWWSPGSILYLM